MNQHSNADKMDMSTALETLAKILNAAPYIINIWGSNNQLSFCNSKVLDIFKISDKNDYIENFLSFSPERQPDGSLSVEKVFYYLNKAKSEGRTSFYWLHKASDGEEIPTKIFLEQIDLLDEYGQNLILGFTKDLRAQIAGSDSIDIIDGYFFNKISFKELFSVVAELSSEWFFVYEVRNSQIQFYGSGSEILQMSKKRETFPDEIIKRKVIHPDDINTMYEMVEAFRRGEVRTFEYRLIMPDGTFRYYKTIYKVLLDKDNKPMFVVGKDYDIHDKKIFEARSKIDLLTNCYNKITTENLISEALVTESGESHALYIIDIDNFKAVNDNLGHQLGDLVLKEIAHNLKDSFRDRDIIGRIGGDEFIVFLKNTKDPAIIEKKAKIIAKAFSNTFSGENKDYKISGSIGIALYPNDGKTYEELYKSADKALYHSKLRGKDMYTFYDSTLVENSMQKLTTLENANRIENSYFDTELMSTIFDLLYETTDINQTLNTVLQYIGRRLSCDRCYIFETFNSGASYNMTFEWCRSGITKQIDNLQDLERTALDTFFDDLEKSGVVYSHDLNFFENARGYDMFKGQDIKSFLVVQTSLSGITSLVLGLDDCTKTRVWTEKDINSLRYSLKMISIFMQSLENRSKHINGLTLSREEVELVLNFRKDKN